MNLYDLLIGKKVNIMTEAKVEVQLEIESVDPQNHSRDLEPATRENDWWPKSEDWTTYNVKFTNGYVKSYPNLESINLVV
jgi:hypothetical protein